MHDSSSGLDDCLSDSEVEDIVSPVQLLVKPNEGTDEAVGAENLFIGSFAVAKFECQNKSATGGMIKKFIGQVISHSEDFSVVTLKFMRKSAKCQNIFIFPVVDDISEVEFSQIVCVVKPLTIKRDRYTFPYELDYISVGSFL